MVRHLALARYGADLFEWAARRRGRPLPLKHLPPVARAFRCLVLGEIGKAEWDAAHGRFDRPASRVAKTLYAFGLHPRPSLVRVLDNAYVRAYVGTGGDLPLGERSRYADSRARYMP